MESLDIMRNRVKDIDRKIITMIKERFDLTKEIGLMKKESCIPLRNWEVEKAVIENAVTLSNEIGLPSEFIKSMMRQIIKESKVQQEIHHFSNYEGNKENILIIGGLGRMGRWFSMFFENQGHNVSIFDIAGTDENFKSYESLSMALNEVTYAVIATSLEDVPETIEKIIDLGFNGTVFDVASLKSHLKPAVDRARKNNISITSIHPMFGPGTRTLSDKVICFCDCGDPEANKKVNALFSDTAASLVYLSFDEHDKIMSYVLALSHIINIIFVKVLMDSGHSSQELARIGSTSYFSQMVTASSVINENPTLYYSIQKENPYKEILFKQLLEATEEISNMIISENKDDFVNLMNNGKEWVGE